MPSDEILILCGKWGTWNVTQLLLSPLEAMVSVFASGCVSGIDFKPKSPAKVLMSSGSSFKFLWLNWTVCPPSMSGRLNCSDSCVGVFL